MEAVHNRAGRSKGDWVESVVGICVASALDGDGIGHLVQLRFIVCLGQKPLTRYGNFHRQQPCTAHENSTWEMFTEIARGTSI